MIEVYDRPAMHYRGDGFYTTDHELSEPDPDDLS
jgi:hypothetical protein